MVNLLLSYISHQTRRVCSLFKTSKKTDVIHFSRHSACRLTSTETIGYAFTKYLLSRRLWWKSKEMRDHKYGNFLNNCSMEMASWALNNIDDYSLSKLHGVSKKQFSHSHIALLPEPRGYNHPQIRIFAAFDAIFIGFADTIHFWCICFYAFPLSPDNKKGGIFFPTDFLNQMQKTVLKSVLSKNKF